MNKKPTVYYQTDPRWAGLDYSAPGERTDIRESGCGPTAAAMVAATWADRREDPAAACRWALAHGYKAPHQGTYYSFFAPYFKRFGVECRQLNGQRIDQAGAAYGRPYHAAVLKALAEGALVIACMGPGLWTRSGHFVLLWGVSGGTAYINDPASSAPARTMGDWGRFQREVKYYFLCRRAEGEDDMTDEQFDQMMEQWLQRQDRKQPTAAWMADGVKNAVAAGISDGSRPLGIATRAEAMMMAANAIAGKK